MRTCLLRVIRSKGLFQFDITLDKKKTAQNASVPSNNSKIARRVYTEKIKQKTAALISFYKT